MNEHNPDKMIVKTLAWSAVIAAVIVLWIAVVEPYMNAQSQSMTNSLDDMQKSMNETKAAADDFKREFGKDAK